MGLVYQLEYRKRLRRKIFEHYGLLCKHCGEKTYSFLTIDHIDRSTKKLSTASTTNGTSFYGWLVINDFPKGYQTLCWNCNILKYKLDIKSDELNLYNILLREKRRQKVLQYYGERCACCNISDLRVLTIDHLDTSMKKQPGHAKSGSNFHHWLIKNNFPPEFQTLCHNCNWGKHIYGVCPHQLR